MEADEAVRLLPVLPWTLAALTVVLLVGLAVPPGTPRVGDRVAAPSPVAARSVAVALAVLAVAAVLGCRLGPVSELRNPVPALVVGLGLPLLLLVPAVLGRRARLARAGALDVRLAVLPAVALVAALVLPARPTSPALVGTAVAAYAVGAVLLSVALGREQVAGRAEVVGLLASWGSLGAGLVRWQAPRGAAAVLAVVLGGAWAERYERSAAWTQRLAATAEVAAGLVVALLLAGLVALALHRTTGAAAAVLLPLAFATALAGALRRALISAQLLAQQASDGGVGVDPDPLGLVGGQAVALGLVAVGGALSAAVLARRVGEGAARLPGTGVLLLASAVSATVVLQP